MRKFGLSGMINGQGLSLTELMVVLSIFVVLMAMIYGSFIMVNYAWQVSSNSIYLQQEARRALISMVKELRSATGVSSPQSDQLDFSVSGIGNIRYALESNQITRKDPSTGLSPDGRSVILANNISSLSFVLGASSVEIDVMAQTTVLLSRVLNFDLSGKVAFRN